MKKEFPIFISWSKESTKKIAIFFKDIIKSMLNLNAYMSEVDIELGSNWFQNLREKLSTSEVALVIITKENINSPWLLFEVGAIWRNKGVDKDSIILTVLVDIDELPPKHPLSHLQGVKFNKNGIEKVMIKLNTEFRGYEEELFCGNFDIFWRSDFGTKYELCKINFL